MGRRIDAHGQVGGIHLDARRMIAGFSAAVNCPDGLMSGHYRRLGGEHRGAPTQLGKVVVDIADMIVQRQGELPVFRKGNSRDRRGDLRRIVHRSNGDGEDILHRAAVAVVGGDGHGGIAEVIGRRADAQGIVVQRDRDIAVAGCCAVA